MIDPTTNKVVQVIGGIAAPHGVGFSPDGGQIYISNESKNALDIVDRTSGQIINEVALSGRPNNIAVTRDGGRVLVAIRSGKGGLDVIDAATRRLVESIPVGGQLHNVYVTPDGKYAVAGSIADHMVTVFDLATDQAACGSTKRIFIELSEFHGVAIVDFATHKEVERIRLPDLRSAEGGRGDETTPCHGIAIAPDGKSLWINSTADNAVFAYSLPDLRLLGHVLLPVRETSCNRRSAPHRTGLRSRQTATALRLQLGAQFSVRDRCRGDEAGRRRARRQCPEAHQYVGVALD